MVEMWQIVMVGMAHDVPEIMREFLGEACGKMAWQQLTNARRAEIDAVKFTYVTLTLGQAAFRKLKDGETRQSVVQAACAAVDPLDVSVPPKLGMLCARLREGRDQ